MITNTPKSSAVDIGNDPKSPAVDIGNSEKQGGGNTILDWDDIINTFVEVIDFYDRNKRPQITNG